MVGKGSDCSGQVGSSPCLELSSIKVAPSSQTLLTTTLNFEYGEARATHLVGPDEPPHLRLGNRLLFFHCKLPPCVHLPMTLGCNPRSSLCVLLSCSSLVMTLPLFPPAHVSFPLSPPICLAVGNIPFHVPYLTVLGYPAVLHVAFC